MKRLTRRSRRGLTIEYAIVMMVLSVLFISLVTSTASLVTKNASAHEDYAERKSYLDEIGNAFVNNYSANGSAKWWSGLSESLYKVVENEGSAEGGGAENGNMLTISRGDFSFNCSVESSEEKTAKLVVKVGSGEEETAVLTVVLSGGALTEYRYGA